MRSRELFTVAGFVRIVSQYLANESDIAAATTDMNKPETSKASKSSLLATVKTLEKQNEGFAAEIRSMLQIAVAQMEPGALVKFLQLDGVLADAIISANYVKEERRANAVKSSIRKNVSIVERAVTDALGGLQLPEETVAGIVAERIAQVENELLVRAGLANK